MEDLMHKIIDDDFGDLLRDLQSSLMIRSVYDGSGVSVEHPLSENVGSSENPQVCEKLGFSTANIANYAGYAEIGSGEKMVGILAHLDVVPEGDVSAWTVPPQRCCR